MVTPVGHVQVSRPIVRQGQRSVQRRIERVPPIATAPNRSIPRHYLRFASRRRHPPYLPPTRHQVVSPTIHAHPPQLRPFRKGHHSLHRPRRIHPQQPRHEPVGDQQPPLPIHRQVNRLERSVPGQDPSIPIHLITPARPGLDGPLQAHPPHPPIPRVRDVQRPIRSSGHGARIPQHGPLRRPFIVTVESPFTRTRHPLDAPAQVHFPDRVVPPVGHVHRAVRSQGQARRRELPLKSGQRRMRRSQQRAQTPVRLHHPHLPIPQIHQVQPPLRPHRQTRRHLQIRLPRQQTVPVEPESTAAHSRADQAVPTYRAHQIVLLVRHVQRSILPRGHGARQQTGGQRRPAVADTSSGQPFGPAHHEQIRRPYAACQHRQQQSGRQQ